MVAPTPSEVRARSEILSGRFPSPSGDAALASLITDASALVSEVTGRAIGSFPGEPLEGAKVPLAVRAITLAAEGFEVGGGIELRETNASGEPGLASFSAGPYSESYFAPGGERSVESLLSPDKALGRLLYLLLTDAKKTALLRLLDPDAYPEEPAFGVAETDFFPEGIDPATTGDRWGHTWG